MRKIESKRGREKVRKKRRKKYLMEILCEKARK